MPDFWDPLKTVKALSSKGYPVVRARNSPTRFHEEPKNFPQNGHPKSDENCSHGAVDTHMTRKICWRSADEICHFSGAVRTSISHLSLA